MSVTGSWNPGVISMVLSLFPTEPSPWSSYWQFSHYLVNQYRPNLRVHYFPGVLYVCLLRALRTKSHLIHLCFKSQLNLCWFQNFKWLSNITIATVTIYVVIHLLSANRNGCGSPFTKTDTMVFFPMWMRLPNVTLPQLPSKGGFCDLFEYTECSISNIMKLLRLKRTWEDSLSLSIPFNHQVNKSSEQVLLDDERHVTQLPPSPQPTASQALKAELPS